MFPSIKLFHSVMVGINSEVGGWNINKWFSETNNEFERKKSLADYYYFGFLFCYREREICQERWIRIISTSSYLLATDYITTKYFMSI